LYSILYGDKEDQEVTIDRPHRRNAAVYQMVRCTYGNYEWRGNAITNGNHFEEIHRNGPLLLDIQLP
jgi:hypothetical protein